MPLESSEFPEEVQVAFFMLSHLSDNWEGMSGTYLGKVWAGADFLFNMYDIEDPKTVFYFMKLYESLLVEHKMKESEMKRKAEERKAKPAGGGNFTHKVKG